MSPEKSSQIAWIAVDWGTSNLRAWALDDQDAVMAHSNSGQGMGKLAAGEFESALLAVIGPWLTQHSQIPVVAAGMVGAGWSVDCHRGRWLLFVPTALT